MWHFNYIHVIHGLSPGHQVGQPLRHLQILPRAWTNSCGSSPSRRIQCAPSPPAISWWFEERLGYRPRVGNRLCWGFLFMVVHLGWWYFEKHSWSRHWVMFSFLGGKVMFWGEVMDNDTSSWWSLHGSPRWWTPVADHPGSTMHNGWLCLDLLSYYLPCVSCRFALLLRYRKRDHI